MHLCPAALGPLASDVPHEAKPMLSCPQWKFYTPTCLQMKHLLGHKAHSLPPPPPAARASSFPILAVKGTLSLPDCFAVPAIHSAGFWLQGRCLLMLQPLNGSLSFRLWEAFYFSRKWHPECFLFPFYFVLKGCQNAFSSKSPSYFGNIVSTKVFLNVYDWGTSQLELKWMCIKIFPLG